MNHPLPPSGGSWIADPETGALTLQEAPTAEADPATDSVTILQDLAPDAVPPANVPPADVPPAAAPVTAQPIVAEPVAIVTDVPASAPAPDTRKGKA